MALHIAVTANDEFIRNFFAYADVKLKETIGKITFVHNYDNPLDFDDDIVDDVTADGRAIITEVVKFADVKWDNVDLYLYQDSLENLKMLMAAAAQGVFSVDLSGYSATLDLMPVVIPDLDEKDLEEVAEKRMCALPHPQVSQLLYLLDPLRKQQDMLYVGVTNVFSASYIDHEKVELLSRQTRNYFNFLNEESKHQLAFNVQPLGDVAPEKQISFEAQILRLCPQVDTVSVHNILAPTFYGNTQMVTVALTTGNIIDLGIVEEWFGTLKDDETLDYKPDTYSQLQMLENLTNTSDFLVEYSHVTNKENVKWVSFTDNDILIAKQAVALINIFDEKEFFNKRTPIKVA